MPELVADPYVEEMVELLPELVYIGLKNTVLILKQKVLKKVTNSMMIGIWRKNTTPTRRRRI